MTILRPESKVDWWDKKSSVVSKVRASKDFTTITSTPTIWYKFTELTEEEILNAAKEVYETVNHPIALSDEEYLMVMGKVVQQLLKAKNGL